MFLPPTSFLSVHSLQTLCLLPSDMAANFCVVQTFHHDVLDSAELQYFTRTPSHMVPSQDGWIIDLQRETEEKARQPEIKLGAIAQTHHTAKLCNTERSRTRNPKPTHGARDRPKQPQPRAGRDRASESGWQHACPGEGRRGQRPGWRQSRPGSQRRHSYMFHRWYRTTSTAERVHTRSAPMAIRRPLCLVFSKP
jgi:hypothetical protein